MSNETPKSGITPQQPKDRIDRDAHLSALNAPSLAKARLAARQRAMVSRHLSR